MTIALLVVCVLLLIGIVLRVNVAVVRWLFVPSSVVAGFVGLIGIQACLAWGATDVQIFSSALSDQWQTWPGWLIAVVFAGMLLPSQTQGSGSRFRSVAAQGIMVWIIVLGESATGLLAVWLLIQPFYDVPNSLGMLIETGFAGGHGTAAAMGEVFASDVVKLPGGKDLGMLMATCGLVYGVLSGVVWINLGVRLNWIGKPSRSAAGETEDHPAKSQIANAANSTLGIARIDSDTVDPLLFQVIWLSLAFGIGLALQSLVMQGAIWVDGWFATSADLDGAQQELSKRLRVSHVVKFPLFIYTLLGGFLVRRGLQWAGRESWIDTTTISRLTSAAMDVLVVAAIASLNVGVVFAFAWPFLILFGCGAIWTAVCLLLISRWILPRDYWFQLGLINYGMSTGTTATGFVLLKMVDPHLKSGAAEDYALAAPLSAPFIGGGIITVALPLLLLESVPIYFPAMVISGLVIGLVFLGRSVASDA